MHCPQWVRHWCSPKGDNPHLWRHVHHMPSPLASAVYPAGTYCFQFIEFICWIQVSFFPWSGSDSLLQSVLQSRHFFGRLRLRLLMAKVPEPTPAPTYLALQHWLQSFVALTSVWDMVIFSWILIIIFFSESGSGSASVKKPDPIWENLHLDKWKNVLKLAYHVNALHFCWPLNNYVVIF